MSYATNSVGLMKRSSWLSESPISRKKSIRSERSMLRTKTPSDNRILECRDWRV
jgi:hypothetical protein